MFQTPNDSIEELDNRLEKKIDFVDLVKVSRQLQVFVLPANFGSDGMTSHKQALAAKTVSNGGLRSRLFRHEFPVQDSGHFSGG